jgi:hypothetical protein
MSFPIEFLNGGIELRAIDISEQAAASGVLTINRG